MRTSFAIFVDYFLKLGHLLGVKFQVYKAGNVDSAFGSAIRRIALTLAARVLLCRKFKGSQL